MYMVIGFDWGSTGSPIRRKEGRFTLFNFYKKAPVGVEVGWGQKISIQFVTYFT